jgi:hypothetical protein
MGGRKPKSPFVVSSAILAMPVLMTLRKMWTWTPQNWCPGRKGWVTSSLYVILKEKGVLPPSPSIPSPSLFLLSVHTPNHV